MATVAKRAAPDLRRLRRGALLRARHRARASPSSFRGLRLGLHVCEDLWNNTAENDAGLDSEALQEAFAAATDDGADTSGSARAYRDNPVDALGAAGIDLFVNVSASPFAAGKPAVRRALVAAAAREWGVPFVYVNQVGANTELIFDGDSQVQTAAGEVVWRARDFAPDLFVWDTDDAAPVEAPLQDEIAAVHDALVLGIRDYVAQDGRGRLQDGPHRPVAAASTRR